MNISFFFLLVSGNEGGKASRPRFMKMNTACKMKFMSPWHFYEYSNVLTKEIKYVLFTDVIMTDTISRDWEFPKVLVSKWCVCTDRAPEPRPHVLMSRRWNQKRGTSSSAPGTWNKWRFYIIVCITFSVGRDNWLERTRDQYAGGDISYKIHWGLLRISMVSNIGV